jgi:predicted lipoprotein with Yx(FWY)xxD motif
MRRAGGRHARPWATPIVGVLVIVGVPLGLAGCSSSPSAAPSGTVVKTASTSFGTILVDGGGRTLYANAEDTPVASHCTGSCASTWPPLAASGTPHAEGNADRSLIATVTRTDGTKQVSYAGHPLYTFTGDDQPGQYRGQGLDGVWHVVSSSGLLVSSGVSPTTTPPSSTTTPHSTTTTTSHATTSTSSSSTTTSSTSTTTTTTSPTTTTSSGSSASY